MLRILVCCVIASWFAWVGPIAVASEVVDFNRDIRPILSDRCFFCHGPDAAHREAGLRLDQPEAATRELESGLRAIVPGDVEQSELVARIESEDEFVKMPPTDSHKSLSAEERELLRRWIEQGAEYQEHWSFRALQRPAVPGVMGETTAQNAVDAFILARLAEVGERPADEADRRTLIRRLCFDLTGLPPSPEEISLFVGDRSPDAYERLVDRLLASPQFGERMAAYWLDIVRYADTKGYHGDNPREIWLYRDYVIEAFNGNKPFDAFTIEQIAGDLLPGATREQKIASGYNHLLQTTQEGGAQAKEYTAIYAADRVRNTSTAWLGLTVGCAQCHDHKFDPISADDFYAFAAFFADVEEVPVGPQKTTKMPTASQQAELDRLAERLKQLNAELRERRPEIVAAFEEWEREYHEVMEGWKSLAPEELASQNGATLTVQEDQSVLLSGKTPDQDTYTVRAKMDLPRITAIRLETLLDPSLPQGTSGRSYNGNFVVTEFECDVTTAGSETPQTIQFQSATADFSQPDFDAANLIDGKPETGWAVAGYDPKLRGNRHVILIPKSPIAAGPGTRVTIRLKQNSIHKRHTIGRFRVSVHGSAARSISLPTAIADILKIPASERDEAQSKTLYEHFVTIAPELHGLREQIAGVQAEQDQILKGVPETLITVAMKEPRVVRRLSRGNWLDESGPIMSPAIPATFGRLKSETERADRLDLAHWIASEENPMTARTMVNRVWLLLFGQAIARTPEDIGSQGEWPTHPQLLDWLAADFVESGWDVKRLMRTIVLSSTYRQSSVATTEQLERDPYNKLFARQGRFRLSAEMVRDNALAVSGLLIEKQGGRSARPYQPAGYYAQLNFPKREYEPDQGSMQYRRGLYTHWQRTFMHPMMKAFDAPTREECTAQRPRSNTPLASLVLLNDPSFVEASQSLARRVLREGGATTGERIDYAFIVAVGRSPDGVERQTLEGLYSKHYEQYTQDSKAARELLAVGEAHESMEDVPEERVAELAAWTSVARVIMTLHETITRS